MTEVILVNKNDQPIGQMDKLEAHQKGLLHRAFSIFVFNNKGEMLLQQRAMGKYHSAGLWTNACCSHPQPGEETKTAAIRRLKEELGFETSIEKIFDLYYRTEFENGLTEHEFDHVFAGEYDGPVNPDPEEIMDISYKSMDEISEGLIKNPEQYTHWFRLAFPGICSWWNQQV